MHDFDQFRRREARGMFLLSALTIVTEFIGISLAMKYFIAVILVVYKVVDIALHGGGGS